MQYHFVVHTISRINLGNRGTKSQSVKSYIEIKFTIVDFGALQCLFGDESR